MRERLENSEIKENRPLSPEEEVSLAKLMKAGRTARIKLAENPNVSQEEMRILASQIREGFAARTTLIVSNLRLVGGIARRYIDRGKSYPDLVQEGCLGLIRAIDKFDYRRGYRVSTLVVWWIRDAITASFRRGKEAIGENDFPLSLDEPGSGGDGEMAPLKEIVADTLAPTLDERVEEGILREVVLTACEQTLTEDQKQVVYRRFGINQEEVPLTAGRRFVMHNSKAPILEAAFESIRNSPFAGALLAQLR